MFLFDPGSFWEFEPLFSGIPCLGTFFLEWSGSDCWQAYSSIFWSEGFAKDYVYSTKNVNVLNFIFRPNWVKWYFRMVHKILKGSYKIAVSECFFLNLCFHTGPLDALHVCLWIFKEKFQQLLIFLWNVLILLNHHFLSDEFSTRKFSSSFTLHSQTFLLNIYRTFFSYTSLEIPLCFLI